MTAGDGRPGEGSVAAPSAEGLAPVVESLLFVAGEPVSLRRLAAILEAPPRVVKAAVELLEQRYNHAHRGVRLFAVAGGYQFRTVPEHAQWVQRLLGQRRARFGRAAMETLAIVAYRQPVTRAEIEAIRGVDAEHAIGALLGRGLIKVAGRREGPGRPLAYATTPEFLAVFGLHDLSELPALEERPEGTERTDDGERPPDGAEGRTAAESAELRGSDLPPKGGGADPGGPGSGGRPGGDDPRGQGGSDPPTGDG